MLTGDLQGSGSHQVGTELRWLVIRIAPMTLTLNAQGLVDTKERFYKNCGLEIFVDIMEQSRQLDKFIQFLNVVIA